MRKQFQERLKKKDHRKLKRRRDEACFEKKLQSADMKYPLIVLADGVSLLGYLRLAALRSETRLRTQFLLPARVSSIRKTG